MPFTFAHPVVTLPFVNKRNKYLDLTALVLGTMAPDFEYFLNFKIYGIYGHTFWGQFFYNLPVVFAVAFLYHYVIKAGLLANLPEFLVGGNSKLSKWRLKSPLQVLIFTYSALLGMLTHLFWDSFTHVDGFFVKESATLASKVTLLNHQLPVFKVLQHGSSMLGLLVLLGYLVILTVKHRKNKLSPKDIKRKYQYWLTVLGTGLLIGLAVPLLTHDFSLGRMIVCLSNGVFLELLVAGLLDWNKNRLLSE